MAYFFADTFDLYSASADAIAGYWDSGAGAFVLASGRFAGSRCLNPSSGSSATAGLLVKSSGANDGIHHLVLAIQQTSALTGTSNYIWLTLGDGATAQCSIVFRSDGAILLTQGASSGATLATYTGAITAINTWYAFEIELRVSNTVGYVNFRKNGNTSNDFASATNLDTAGGTANDYANRLSIGYGAVGGTAQFLDDLIWRSDASSVSWMGDVRGWARMPVSDASVQWTPNAGGTNYTQVDEAQQNAATDYVFSSTVGNSDLYGISSISSTPASVVAVVTRAYVQKSDAGTRNVAVQLRSGGTTVQGTSTALNTVWGWLSRTDLTDPATGAAWTATGVNNAQIGVVVTA